MNLATKLKAAGIKDQVPRKAPLWAGPCDSGPMGGITQSLLSRFLCCRERSRLKLVEGLAPLDQFNQRLEYGNMWHVCEEALALGANPIVGNPIGDSQSWRKALTRYVQELGKRYPTQGEQIIHWASICALQFPIYVNWWKKHPEVTKRQRVFEEAMFRVPYKLPSERVVYLRGKWDSVDYIPGDGYILQENKTKGDVDEGEMKRNLTFDLQTGLYITALEASVTRTKTQVKFRPDCTTNEEFVVNVGTKKTVGLSAIRYNVIRRPLAGGRHSIRQHQPSKSNPTGESTSEFYDRLAGLIEGSIEDDGSHYFFSRWRVDIMPGDIEKFKRQCLTPVLEQLCDWWEWIVYCWNRNLDPFGGPEGQNCLHFRYPYGVYNVTLEGGSSELDEYLLNGSTAGLKPVETLFPELETVCP